MPHPDRAFAFNELSLACCGDQVDAGRVIGLLDEVRGWLIVDGLPLVQRLKGSDEYEEVRKGPKRDKVALLLEAATNARGPSSAVQLRWNGTSARGFPSAHHLGGWALSWPCSCAEWSDLVIGVSDPDGAVVECRHVADFEHLKTHWQVAVRLARRRPGRPSSVQRVDGINNSGAEVPQIHFRDGTALNIDGSWKHGMRQLNLLEVDWLRSVGWVVP